MREHPISRRKATPTDLPFLVKLRRETMDLHFAASGVIQSEEEHVQRVLVRFESAEILVQDSEPIGLLKVVREGLNWELVQVQLCPSHQGQGLGTKLLKQLISEAQVANANLRLSVLKANPARRVYERLGFTVVAEMAHAFEMQRPPIGGGTLQAAERCPMNPHMTGYF
jgi:ribosomal protein S18 acetylase RimI-like enzyme